jgi:hypothetical protein
MKKLFAVTLLVLFICIKLNAQTINIEWGKPTQETGKKLNPVTFIGKDDKFIYLQKTGGQVGTIIEKYNISTLTRVYSQDLKTPGFQLRANPSDWAFIKIIIIKDKLLFISSETENDTHTLYATEIAPNGLLTTNKIKIMEVPFKPVGRHDVITYAYSGNFFDVIVAEDHNSFYAYPTTIENATFPIDIVSDNLSVVEKAVSIDLKEKAFVDHVSIQGDNASMFIKTPFAKKEQFSNDGVGYAYSYANIDLKKSTITMSDFALNNQKIIIASYVSTDDKKNLYYYGFYTATKASIYQSTGMFCIKIDPLTGKRLNELDFDYDDETLLNFKEYPYTKEKEALKNRVVQEVEIQKIISKEDGGIIIIAEKNYQGYNGKYYTYIADNILVMNLNDKMELKNKTIIPKAQQGDSYGRGKFNSYFCFYKNGVLSLIYNDSPKNIDETDHGKQIERLNTNRLGGSDKMTMAITTVDKDGNWKKQELQKYSDNAACLMPAFSIPTGKNQAIIYSEKDDEIKLATIKY